MFNLNLMYGVIVLVLFYDVCALCESHEGLLNVGTVLFQSDDLNQKMWTLADIRLLEARRRLQGILPSPRSIDTTSEDYINDVIKYFTNAFRAVKKEGTDGTDVILDRALADTVGGFFKVFVLPVTKYAYYGGSVSEDNAMKAFQYYEDLKNQLHTDGSGWRDPDEYILNSIAISVIPLSQASNARSMRKLCEHLAFYEMYNNSFTVPTPYIYYDENAMFLPIINESVILLDSPSSSKALLKYYNIAGSCCNLNNPDGCDEFESRFQHWLSKDVVPHLADDKLYRAFYSVLSLLDKTKQLYAKKPDDGHEHDGLRLTSIPPGVTSKKSLILIAILFIEIVWCVPTLIYIFCCGKKRKESKRRQFISDIFKRRKYQHYTCETLGRSETGEGNSAKNTFRISRIRNVEVDTQYPSNTSKRSFGQVTESFPDIIDTNECFVVIDDTQTKSATKKKSVNSSEVQTVNDASYNNFTGEEQPRFATFKNLDATIRKMTSNKSVDNCISCVKRFNCNETVGRASSKMGKSIQREVEKNETNDTCQCPCCQSKDKRNDELSTKRRATADIRNQRPGSLMRNINVTLEPSTRPGKPIDKNISRRVTDNSKAMYAEKSTTMNNTKSMRLNPGQPLLEIRINKPTADVTVDMDKVSRASNKNARPSKIPRRTAFGNFNEGYAQSKSNAIPNNRKFYDCTECDLDQRAIKKRSADELDIKKKAVKRNKMNLTL